MSKLEFSPEMVDAFQKLSLLLETDDGVDRTLALVADLSVAAVPGCDSAGVMIRVGGKDMTVAASDGFTREIDEIQYETNEGPCVAALELGEPMLVRAVSEESRWPEFCLRAKEKGLGSGSSYPLKMNGSLGSLNLYSLTERAFDEASVELGEIFVRQASTALHNAVTYGAARRLADQLNEALATRDVIGQAKGILMEREGISDEEAFAMLRVISQKTNVKLRDIAAKLVNDRAGEGAKP